MPVINTHAKVPIVVYEGATFQQTFQWKTGSLPETSVPVDLTGYTAKMQARVKLTDEIPLFDLTTQNGGIIIEAPEEEGKYTIYISDTKNKCGSKRELVVAQYDLFLISGSGVASLQQYGTLQVFPSNTRIV